MHRPHTHVCIGLLAHCSTLHVACGLQEAHASAGLSASQTAERLQGALEASEAELSKAREELDAQRGAVAEMQEQVRALLLPGS